jgi:hypothetical protein
MQRETCMGGNKEKKNIKQTDLPAEAQESSSDKYKAGHAEHGMQHLSSEPAKACSFAEISESHDRGKDNSETKQAEEHSAH